MPRAKKILLLILGLSLFANLSFASPAKSSKPQAINPKSIELNERGAQAIKQKDFSKAEELFREALAADTSNVTAAFNLGGIYITQKREADAISLLEEYVNNFPQDVGLHVRLGDAYFTAKKADQALKSYEKAFAMEKNYAGLATKLGTVYSLNNRLKDAERALLVAVEQEPKNAQLLANLGSVFLANGKVDQAISTVKRGLQVQASSELYITLGSAYEVKKDFKNSLIAFQRAQDMGSSKPELKTKIDQLKKMAS